MTNKLLIDFETRSACDIKNAGAYVYSLHPSTEVLCMAYAIDDGPVQLWTPDVHANLEAIDYVYDERYLFELIRHGILVEAHGVFFEKCIWNSIMVPRYGWPEISPDQWRCTMAKAAVRGLPRALEDAGAAVDAPILKDAGGKAVMMKVSRPRRATKKVSAGWNEDPRDLATLFDYCKTDVAAERSLGSIIRDLSPEELKVWQLDQRINQRGVYIDKEGCEAALALIAEYETKLLAEFREISGGDIDTPGQRDLVIEHCRKEGVELPGYTKQILEDALRVPNVPAKVRRMLEIRQQLGKTSNKKFERMLACRSEDGRIRDMLMYHGASTGRWTGKLVQLQNLVRGSISNPDEAIELMRHRDLDLFAMFFPDVMGAISSCIRGMICAAPGNDLIAADYAAIESRVLLWLAGDEKALEMYRQNVCLYRAMAQQIYRVPNPENVSKQQREIGKRAVLGCGYQMGGKRFVSSVKEYAGIEIEMTFGVYVVQKYREANPLVVGLWAEQEAAAIAAAENPGAVQKSGRIAWCRKRQVLYARLPSGRLLSFNDPRVSVEETPWGGEKKMLSYMGVDAKTKQWQREKTYGGKIVENLVQGIARDIMANGMLQLEEAKYPLVLSVHDELASEQEVGFGAVEEFTDIMCKLPAWAAGCPIKAEGWRGKRYKK